MDIHNRTASAEQVEKIKVIIDTDLNTDCDDVGALQLACDASNLEILGICVNEPIAEAAVAASSIAAHYEYDNVRIAVAREKETGLPEKRDFVDDRNNLRGNVASLIAHYWPGGTIQPPRDELGRFKGGRRGMMHYVHMTAWDPVKLYRDILENATDNSITIASIGFLNNLSDLLNSPGGEGKLSGRELVEQKVKKIVIMGGDYPCPPRATWNFTTMGEECSANVIHTWPGPITFLGSRVGNEVKTGLPLVESDWIRDLTRMAYINYNRCEPQGSWDLLAILYISHGEGDLFNERDLGGLNCVVDKEHFQGDVLETDHLNEEEKRWFRDLKAEPGFNFCTKGGHYEFHHEDGKETENETKRVTVIKVKEENKKGKPVEVEKVVEISAANPGGDGHNIPEERKLTSPVVTWKAGPGPKTKVKHTYLELKEERSKTLAIKILNDLMLAAAERCHNRGPPLRKLPLGALVKYKRRVPEDFEPRLKRKADLEICANSLASALAAAKGGAKRIELCMDLDQGGLTPPSGLTKEVLAEVDIPVHVLIRPRTGDFVYNESEISIMTEEISTCKDLHAEGVVFGVLKEDGKVDVEACERLIKLASPMEVTFHRAIDDCEDWEGALKTILKLDGVSRILTSGGEKRAVDATDRLKKMVEMAGDRLMIMPGAGIAPDNIEELVNKTGAKEFHASASKIVETKGERKSMFVGNERRTDEGIVKELADKLGKAIRNRDGA